MRAPAARSAARPADHSRSRQPKRTQQHPHLERLEPRLLFTVGPVPGSEDDYSAWQSHGGVCSCPVCTGVGLDQIPVIEASGGGPGATNPLSSLPQLHSNAGAPAKLFLDFNGNFVSTWGSWSNATTPVYDQDGDASTFSNGELASIYEIWARVAEDYAPFNIDVTTVDPGSLANQVVAHIAIGGNWSDWYGSGAGGVAYIGGFYNGASNVGFVFEEALGNGNAKYVAEAASHEAGHLFALQHQALWNGTTLSQPYNQGNAAWAPIMGNGYYSARTTFHNGTTNSSSTTFQDDLSILTNVSNAFGYRTDDFGSTLGGASALPTIGTSVNFSGLIGRYDDVDVWSFSTTGGNVTFQLAGSTYGSNLDSILELWNSGGGVLVSASPSGSLGASLSMTVGAGTYYLVARSLGDYGNMGQYTITGSLPVAAPAPEITIRLNGADVIDGQAIDFGSVVVGNVVTRTFTIVNDGNDTLTLAAILPNDLPAGFSIVTNLGSTTLAAGQSTTFTIQFDAAAAGTFGGNLAIANNDSNEGPFDLALSAVATVPAGEISVSVGGQSLSLGGTVNFGSTVPGYTLERTFTVRNDGSAVLNLTNIDPQALPAGFSIYQNLGSTTLNPGQSTTFVLRLDGAALGTFSGTVTLVNNDTDEGPFTFQVSGTVAAPAPPFKAIVDDGNTGSKMTGAWTVASGSGKGYSNDSRTANKGNGSTNATWTFSSLPAGQYQVFATWKSNSANATNSPFTIYDNTTSKGTTRVNQKLGPAGLSADGAVWQSIGVATISSGKLVVKLTNSANNKVVADAIRIERVGVQNAPVSDIGVSIGDYGLTSGLSGITFGPQDLGNSLTYSFTVTNHGVASLQLTAIDPASVPAGFTLVQNLGATFLTPGESTTFSLRLDASAGGSFSGNIVVASNDPDESAFSFQVSGTVVDPNAPVMKIIDEGTAGHSQSGTWTNVTGKGYFNDMRTAKAGTGSIQSTWSFTSLPNGQYNVWGTWRIGSTYATNAPFSLYNGTQLVSTTQVNQRLTPAGLWDGTTNWKSLGTVTVSGGVLTVKLTNGANGLVVADAIRIEKILGSNADSSAGAPGLTSKSSPAAGSGLAGWFGSIFASGGSASVSNEAPTTTLTLPSPTASLSAPADAWIQAHRDTALEDQLLADTLELLSTARSALHKDGPTTLQAAADELALDALLV